MLGFHYHEVDGLIEKLEFLADMQQREQIGGQILQQLQGSNALIRLMPVFIYILWNLYLVPSPGETSMADLFRYMPDVLVQRGKNWRQNVISLD